MIKCKTLTNKKQFTKYFDQIKMFCNEASNETIRPQTSITMGSDNWENNNECLLYRIYKTNKMIDNNGACAFLFDGDKIVGSGGVELWNKDVSSMSKRTYLLKKYRQQYLSSKFLTPACVKWTEDNHPKVKLYMLTYNEYVKDTMLSTMIKFLNRELDGDWNFWPEWNLYPGTINIYDLEQYVIYKLVDESIENKPENIKRLILNET